MDAPGFSVRPVRWDPDGACARIRRAVFIAEQGVPENLEWDALDAECFHWVATDADGIPVGCARMTRDGQVGRMAVLRDFRQRGVGSLLLRALLAAAREQGLREIRLNAQRRAEGFYRRHGFAPRGGEFLDAGIPHVAMAASL